MLDSDLSFGHLSYLIIYKIGGAGGENPPVRGKN